MAITWISLNRSLSFKVTAVEAIEYIGKLSNLKKCRSFNLRKNYKYLAKYRAEEFTLTGYVELF